VGNWSIGNLIDAKNDSLMTFCFFNIKITNIPLKYIFYINKLRQKLFKIDFSTKQAYLNIF